MKWQGVFSLSLLLCVLAACSSPNQNTPATLPGPERFEAPEPGLTAAAEPAPTGTAPADCLGEGISPLGQSIAADYETASYAQVMAWFCSGAEFEDILLALETEAQTGLPAEEMLTALAEGLSWDEIWGDAGLTD